MCYFVLVSRNLWSNVDPLLPLVTVMLLCSTVFFLLLTSCSDPGIIPRREMQFLVDGLIDEVAMVTGCAKLNRTNIIFTQEMDNEGYRWCPTCKIVRPPRASHCRVCDNCVLRFDHHCPFVNNCIGQRNYVYFNGFLVSVLGLGISVFGGFALHLSGSRASSKDAQTKGEGLLIFLCLVGLPTAVMLIATLGLALFHTFLIASGKTTKEVLKGSIAKQEGSGAKVQDSFTVRGPPLLHPRDRTIYPNEVP
jgi:hypothetical protein